MTTEELNDLERILKSLTETQTKYTPRSTDPTATERFRVACAEYVFCLIRQEYADRYEQGKK